MTDTTATNKSPEPVESTRPADAAIDAAVLGRVAAGDQLALAELYDRFARRVYSLARRICRDDTTTEDATQEVFLTAWRSAGKFDPARGTAASWLLNLTHHKAVDAVRRNATTVRRRTQPLSDDGWELPAGPGADHAAIDSVVAGHVRDALAELPPAQRRALTLAYYGGHTQPEIAAILDIPLGTVKSRTFHALALLRARLQPPHHPA